MSAILQEKPVETIFDYDVTHDELVQLSDGYPETKEEYFYGLSSDGAYADLYRLFMLRKDINKANLFLSQIQDSKFKQQFTIRPCCAVHS